MINYNMKTHFTIIYYFHKHYSLGTVDIRKGKILKRFFQMTFISMFKLHNYILIQSYQILVKLILYTEPELLDFIIPNVACLEFRI